jgi:SAM-dependent methyltransferase
MSRSYGFDRGTPVDRFYIERFLAGHSNDIQGTVLEVVGSDYSRRFGGNRIATQHVIDLRPGNNKATIVGDLTDPAVLPDATFDCIILTQTLHLIYDLRAAVRQVHRSLRPGGVLLVTVPGITPVRSGEDHRWYWSLTDDALRRLIGESFPPERLSVSVFGNLFAATAFLHGAAVEEIPAGKLEPYDPAYPVTVAARAVA